MSTPVSFEVDGDTVRGQLYRPDGPGQLPCIVLAHGFSGTMDWILPQYAARFAAAGWAALAFDYRCFGESDGKPRQLVSVKRQRADLRAAIAFARAHPDNDAGRIALWGTSLGGGHVIAVAAEDPGIAAVIAQMPGIDMLSREARPRPNPAPPAVRVKIVWAAVRDAVRGAIGLSPHYMKVFAKDGEAAAFTDPALEPRFRALMEGSPSWRNEITPRFFLAPPRYRPGTMEKLRMPVLFCLADQEVYMNQTFLEKLAGRAPRAAVKHYPGGHFDLYHGLFEQVIADELEFLERYS